MEDCCRGLRIESRSWSWGQESIVERCASHHLTDGSGPRVRKQVGHRYILRMVNVRYMVSDVEAAVVFYVKHLGFTLLSKTLPAFADVSRGELRLLLSGPASSAGRPMPDGRVPGPGGWNRIELVVDDLAAEVGRLRSAGLKFRNDIVP